jgi:hypothetical protein
MSNSVHPETPSCGPGRQSHVIALQSRHGSQNRCGLGRDRNLQFLNGTEKEIKRR